MAGSPGKDALYKAVESGDYCDLRLRLSDDTELKVHRVVLCTQCEFFANAIKPGHFLANSSVIDLKNDPPQAIRRLVEFLYTGRYTVNGLRSLPNEYAEFVLAHADVYVVSKLYEVPKLEEEACNAIKSALEEPKTLEVFPRLVHTIYSGVAETTCAIHDDIFRYAQSNVAELISGDHFGSMIQNAPGLIEKLMRHLVSSDSTKTGQLLQADVDIKRLQDEVKGLQDRVSLLDEVSSQDKISLQDKDDKMKGLQDKASHHGHDVPAQKYRIVHTFMRKNLPPSLATNGPAQSGQADAAKRPTEYAIPMHVSTYFTSVLKLLNMAGNYVWMLDVHSRCAKVSEREFDTV
ncbi:hypothetical protein DIS24_g8038 [Lasiodiplodia hormozganensis]|uniref:BTB domain-containing protein n=1 Tax=Lasiodiplodia hormozganensis TaxID=869390 RepID=A0AA39Y561_9PEZI|nr:hypothetical protein DIS24_g8038 [Lasiodiplodia hormozganensis]